MKPFSNVMYGAAMQESVPFGADFVSFKDLLGR